MIGMGADGLGADSLRVEARGVDVRREDDRDVVELFGLSGRNSRS